MEVLTFSVNKNIFEKKDLRINTVTLSHNNKDVVGLFRCIFCGEAIKQYKGDVKKITPGVEPSDQVLTIDKCHNYECGALYTFQTFNYKNKNTIVNLSIYPITKTSQYFFCFVCRKPLLKYSYEWAGNLQLGVPFTFPYSCHCQGHLCSANYLFKEVI